MSPRRNWDSPNPSPASEYALPPGPRVGGAHSPAAKGVGESQFRRLEKKLSTLPTLCLYQIDPCLFHQCASSLGPALIYTEDNVDNNYWPVGRLDGSAVHTLLFIPLVLYLHLQS
jgi:hypothetical protein